MARKIPPEAFSFYLGLGTGRSYESVARQYGVSKRAIAKAAHREKWQPRLEAAETKVRERTEAKAVETIEQVNTRHLKILRAIQQKALEALRSMPIASGSDAARALVLAMDRERVVLGEPVDRTAVSIEDVIRREYETMMVSESEPSPTKDGREPADGRDDETVQ